MNLTAVRILCTAGIALAAAACSSLRSGVSPTPTPTGLVVSTPFTLPPSPPPGQAETRAPGLPVGTASAAGTPLPTHPPSFSKTLLYTQPPPAPQSPGGCAQVAPGNPIDVTIPDYTELQPGESFVKTWRLVNSGECAWTSEYAAVWFSGDTLSAPPLVPFSQAVASGQAVDITVDMRAPEAPGAYQSNWKLSNNQGELFGIGPAGNAPFWVRILVVTPASLVTPPAPTQTALPEVLVSGLANLIPGDTLDLDTNRSGAASGSDLVYTRTAAGSLQLEPAAGTWLGSLLNSQPGMSDCQAGASDPDPLRVNRDTTGLFFCYHTSLGLPGWARLVLLDDSSGALTLELLTWSAP